MALLCIIDTETTGLGKFDRSNPSRVDYPISIGVVIADFDMMAKKVRYVDGMYSLIRIPDPSRAEDTMLIHGILPEELEDAPKPSTVCMQLRDLLSRYGPMPIGAWNHRFDRHFVDLLFGMGRMKAPSHTWIEMMPEAYSKLDDYVTECVTHDGILCLEAHNAFNDCIRAMAVYAALHGYNLEMAGSRVRIAFAKFLIEQ